MNRSFRSNRTGVPGLALVPALMIAGSLSAYAAKDVTPLLQLSDNLGNVVTVDGGGNYTCTGTCTNGGIVAAAGTVSFKGSVGALQVLGVVGISNSAATSSIVAPGIDVGIGTFYNSGSATGTLSVIWTDVGFTGVSPTTITPLTNYTGSPGSTNYYMYVDNTNNDYQGIASGSSTLSASALGVTGPITAVSGAGITANPFGITLKEDITLGSGGTFTNDFSGTTAAGSISVTVPPSPMLSLNKCVTTNGTTCVTGSTTVAPFQKVWYLYTVTNTSTNTTTPVTNITITDDNATPNYTADDFTVCKIGSLAPGKSTTCTAYIYPPITEGANDNNGWNNSSFNYGNYHPGGTLICRTVDNNGNLITNGGSGNLEFHWVLDEATLDNTYGSGAKGDWSWGSSFSNLVNNAGAEFQVYDAKGNKCIDVWHDYLSSNWSAPSGYANGGITYGSGGNYVLSTDTSLSRCLNKNKATAQCTNNSPSTSSEWNSKCAYIVRVSSSCWGSNGFGKIECPSTTTGNPKNSQCGNHSSKPVNSTATNTAVAVGVFCGASGSQTVTSNKATATVAIVATPTQKCQVPVQLHCNVYAQAPSNCKPINGGHDNDGYCYSDSLLTSTINWNGTQFQLGGGSDPSASTGQKIPLPSAQCSSVKFLAAGVNGAQYNQPFTINYTDGSSTTVYQNLSDWCNPSGFSGESNVLTMPYRITPNGSQQWINTSLYGYSIPTNSNKTIDSITCPNNRNVIVHAITLCP